MASPNPSHPMDDLVADNARLRREVKRYRAWLRAWVSRDDDAIISETEINDALAGKPAPRKVKR